MDGCSHDDRCPSPHPCRHPLFFPLPSLRCEEMLDSPRLTSFSPSMTPSPKAFRSLGLAGPTGQVEDARVCGVHKGTVVRGEADCSSGQLQVTDCHDTVVYALAPIQVRGVGRESMQIQVRVGGREEEHANPGASGGVGGRGFSACCPTSSLTRPSLGCLLLSPLPCSTCSFLAAPTAPSSPAPSAELSAWTAAIR